MTSKSKELPLQNFYNYINSCQDIFNESDKDIEFINQSEVFEFVNTANYWEHNKDLIINYSHLSKSYITHIVLVNQHNELIIALYRDLLHIENKLLNLNKVHKISHISKLHKNTWYIEFWGLIYSYQEWFEERFKFRLKTNKAV
jgi:hypothetical protein